jgi:hypothetical protein
MKMNLPNVFTMFGRFSLARHDVDDDDVAASIVFGAII